MTDVGSHSLSPTGKGRRLRAVVQKEAGSVETDFYKLQLQTEQYQSFILSQQIHVLEAEIQHRKTGLNPVLSVRADEKSLAGKLVALEQQLGHAIERTSETKAQNSILRQEVDMHRMDLLKYKKQIQTIIQTATEVTKSAVQANMTFSSESASTSFSKMQVQQVLKARSRDRLSNKEKLDKLSVSVMQGGVRNRTEKALLLTLSGLDLSFASPRSGDIPHLATVQQVLKSKWSEVKLI